MERLDPADNTPLAGTTRPRCAECQRFARLLTGETTCAACSGVLALEFPTISRPSDATGRGGW